MVSTRGRRGLVGGLEGVGGVLGAKQAGDDLSHQPPQHRYSAEAEDGFAPYDAQVVGRRGHRRVELVGKGDGDVHLEDARGVGINLERAGADEPDGWESHAGGVSTNRAEAAELGVGMSERKEGCGEFKREPFVFLSLFYTHLFTDRRTSGPKDFIRSQTSLSLIRMRQTLSPNGANQKRDMQPVGGNATTNTALLLY